MENNNVVNTYENYSEENRFNGNSTKIEFNNTIRILKEHITGKLKILDCAAGTGAYAFHLAELGHSVTATDITPRHIKIINDELVRKPFKMDTAVLDATNMEIFPDNSFDVVLNMGAFYHIIDEEKRRSCLKECLRVLKPGGLLCATYISRFFIFQYVALSNTKFIDNELSSQLLTTGISRHGEENCFWTDTYYASPEEMESLFTKHNLEIVDHFAQDGLTPYFESKINNFTDVEFATWCENHYKICREPTQLGSSNHIMIIGRK